MPKSLTTSYTLSDQQLRNAVVELQGAVVDQLLNTGGLAIGSGSKKKVLIANTVYALIDGVLVKKTTAEVDPAGTVVNATFNVFVLSMTANGTVTVTMGTAGATIGAVVFPTIPADSVVLGFVIVNPTGTGNFVGASTDFDDGTVVPNAVYVNTVGTFNPNVLAL
jgi:hypothetical protein